MIMTLRQVGFNHIQCLANMSLSYFGMYPHFPFQYQFPSHRSDLDVDIKAIYKFLYLLVYK